MLESMIEEIEEYWDDDEELSRTSDSQVKVQKNTNKVFVIHGHDKSAQDRHGCPEFKKPRFSRIDWPRVGGRSKKMGASHT